MLPPNPCLALVQRQAYAFTPPSHQWPHLANTPAACLQALQRDGGMAAGWEEYSHRHKQAAQDAQVIKEVLQQAHACHQVGTQSHWLSVSQSRRKGGPHRAQRWLRLHLLGPFCRNCVCMCIERSYRGLLCVIRGPLQV